MDVGRGQPITLILGPSGWRVGQPTSCPPSSPPSVSALQHCPPRLSHALGLAHPHQHHRGQLYCVVQARYRGHFPKGCSWWEAGPAPLRATGFKRGPSFPQSHHHMGYLYCADQVRCRAGSPEHCNGSVPGQLSPSHDRGASTPTHHRW